MTTINISLPDTMYEDARKMLVSMRYASISEFVRDALRSKLYPKLTVNGFTPEFEEKVLQIAATRDDDDLVLKTEKDIDNYFMRLKKPRND